MRALVTGGNGFLGRHIVARCLQRGWQVRTLHRSPAEDLAAHGVEVIRGDCAERAPVLRATSDCDLVFHVAAKAGVWGPWSEYHRANVLATEQVLAGCRTNAVPRLIHTSTPSVTFAGRDQDGVDESTPLAEQFLCAYPATKAIAEKAVLAANGPGLATVALRPHLIWGTGDPHLLPRLCHRHRLGRVRIIGSGEQLVDSTVVDNAADAHLQAADHLQNHTSPPAGRAYFISNGQPLPIRTLLNDLVAAHAGLPPIERHIGARTAYAAGATLEAIYRLVGKRAEPPMTRFVARQLATAHWFRLDAARRDFGYSPAVSIEEGLERLCAEKG